MPQIVRFYETGGPEVLKLENVDAAASPPGPDEVLIDVKALGLNRAECMFRLGRYLQEPKFPSRIGYEAAGHIRAVGSNVKDFAKGDAVSVVPHSDLSKYGVYGEIATVPAYFVVKHPQNLSFEEAAATWMQYLTAYGALIDIAQLKKNDYIVITAASSSVGLAAIQLANMVGAIPIAATRTSAKRKALQEAGATHVIATEEEDLAAKMMEYTQNKGVRVVFDPVGGKTVTNLAKGMAYNGILFQYGGLSAEATPFPLMIALSKGLTMRGYTLFEIISDATRFAKAKKFVYDALSAGKLKPVIAKTFPLKNIVEAHRYMESNQQFGKIVITV